MKGPSLAPLIPPFHVVVAIAGFDLRDFAREVLERAGFTVVTAATRDAALYMLTRPDPPRVVVVEGAMPLLEVGDALRSTVVELPRTDRYGVDEAGALLESVYAVIHGR